MQFKCKFANKNKKTQINENNKYLQYIIITFLKFLIKIILLLTKFEFKLFVEIKKNLEFGKNNVSSFNQLIYFNLIKFKCNFINIIHKEVYI